MTRWRTMLAVVAVVLGCGGFLTASAAEVGGGSVFVPIAPIRLLDTRIGAGLPGALVSDVPVALQVTGVVATVGAGDVVSSGSPVPAGATGVVTNTTVVGPSTIGFLAVRPGNAAGEPATSSINFTSPGAIVPNAVTTELPTAGSGVGAIQLWFHGTSPTATTHVLVDVVGYYEPAGTSTTPLPGPQGSTGEVGPTGATGPQGPGGAVGVPFRQQVVTEHLGDARQPAFVDATIGSNGLPLIVFNDRPTNALTVLACIDANCAAAPIANIVSANGDQYAKSSIAIGADGNPVISYRDAVNKQLRVAACSTPTCAGTATSTTIDSGDTTGAESAITIGTNGKPVVAYRRTVGTNSSLQLALCESATCSGTSAIVPLDIGVGTSASTASGTGTGWFPSIVIGATGAPLVSYIDGSNYSAVKLAVCASATCATSSSVKIAAGPSAMGANDIALGPNGNPIIGYWMGDSTFAVCGSATCAGPIQTHHTDAAGFGPSLAVTPAGGVLMVSRPSYTTAAVVACASAACDVRRSYQIAAGLHAPAINASNTSIVMRPDGLPLIVLPSLGNLHDADPTNDNGTLRIIACGNPLCSPFVEVG